MQSVAEEIRHLLDREVDVHRDLLALARARHFLLRQGRWVEALRLRPLEARCVAALRALEARRAEVSTEHPGIACDVSAVRRRIGVLIRNLGAVERANRVLWGRLRIPAQVLQADGELHLIGRIHSLQ